MKIDEADLCISGKSDFQAVHIMYVAMSYQWVSSRCPLDVISSDRIHRCL